MIYMKSSNFSNTLETKYSVMPMKYTRYTHKPIAVPQRLHSTHQIHYDWWPRTGGLSNGMPTRFDLKCLLI